MDAAAALEAWIAKLDGLELASGPELFSDDVVVTIPYQPPGFPGRIEGLDTWGPMLGQLAGLFRSGGITESTVWSTNEPDVAIARAHAHFTLINDDIYTQDYVFIVRVRDGKICEYTEYVDVERAKIALAAAG